jgi:hypothetical protein
VFPDAVSISGDTPEDKRRKMIDDFKAGRAEGADFKAEDSGVWPEFAGVHAAIFSGLKDSLRRILPGRQTKQSHRIISTVARAYTSGLELEVPFVDNVLRKAGRVESDTAERGSAFQGNSQCRFLMIAVGITSITAIAFRICWKQCQKTA